MVYLVVESHKPLERDFMQFSVERLQKKGKYRKGKQAEAAHAKFIRSY